MAQKQLPIESPINGVNQVTNREGQPPNTCWSAQNVLPFDYFGRRRVAQRPGLTKRYTTNLGSSFIQGMLAVNQVTYASGIGGGGGGSTTFTEPFTSLAEFKSTWQNVPSTWTVSGGQLHIPAGWNPSAGDPIPTLIASTFLAQNIRQYNISFTYSGEVTSTNGAVSIDYGLNATPPNQGAATSGLTDLDYNFSGIINGGTSSTLLLTVGPAVFSSTTSDAAYASTSPNQASSTNFVLLGNYTGTLASMVGSGVSTDSNTVSTNTGNLAVTLTGSTLPWFTMSALPAGISASINTISITSATSGSTVAALQMIFQSILIAVDLGYVWIGSASPGSTIAKALGQVTPRLVPGTFVSMAAVNYTSQVGFPDANAIGQAVYFVDGVSSTIAALNLATSTMQFLVPKTGGNPPPAVTSLACNWRGRLVLAGDPNNPQNFYMSRQGDPSDWDYSQLDSAAAVAGNLSNSGKIGEPITALIPYTDDIMLMGCANSLWMIQGDLADGGTILRVSEQMGIMGKDAWCVDPQGTLYFICSGGLYSVKPIWEMYQPPQLLTAESMNQFFMDRPWSLTRVSMAWDTDHHYLHMYLTDIFGPNRPSAHLIYDTRTGGLWPQLMGGYLGPTSAILYLGDNSPTDRSVLLGGWDGYIRKFDYTATDDDGTPISSFVILGPFKPFPEAGILIACTIDMGEISPRTVSSTFGATVRLSSGPDAYSVTEGLPHTDANINLTMDRRQKTFRQRLRGGWFTIGLYNFTDNQYFSFESGLLEFDPAGRNRERR
jgi:hypothetical protein